MEVPPDDPSSVELAWKIHSAIDAWTGKADLKASIMLPLETAALGFVASQSSRGHAFSNLTGWHLCLYWSGVVILGGATLAAGAVVFPRLNAREAKRRWKDNFIYFGHLRHWEEEALAAELRAAGPRQVDALATQLVTMSKIAWRKHVCLQASVIGLMAAAACLVIAGLLR